MAIAARKHGVELRGLTFAVRKDMAPDLPRRIGRLVTEVRVPLPADHPAAQPLMGAARACPVHRSLHPDIDAPITFQWE
jgi:uncharacterized OsmC-like protein